MKQIPRKWLVWVGVIASVLVIGCIAAAFGGGDEEPTPTSTPGVTASPTAADDGTPEPSDPADETLAWQEGRPPALKQIIDEDAASGNCTELKSIVDTWADAEIWRRVVGGASGDFGLI